VAGGGLDGGGRVGGNGCDGEGGNVGGAGGGAEGSIGGLTGEGGGGGHGVATATPGVAYVPSPAPRKSTNPVTRPTRLSNVCQSLSMYCIHVSYV
jgi:hypothetical protein